MVQLNNKENARLRSSQSDLYKDTGNAQPPKKAILKPQRGLIRMVLLISVIGAALVGTLIMQELLSDPTPKAQPTHRVPISQNRQGGNQPDGNTFTATGNSLVSGQLDQAQVNQRFPIVAGIAQTVAATFQSLYDADSGERTIAAKDGGISFDITKKAKYLYVDLKEDGTYFKVQDNGIDVFRVDYDKNVIVHKGATFHLLGKLKDNTGSLGNASQVLTAPGGNGSPTWEDANALTVGGLDCTNCINQDEIKDVYLFNTGDTITGDLTLNSQSDLRLADSNSSNYVAFQAPATVSSNVTWTLPSADGSSSQTLSTDGSGTLSWVSTGVSADSLDFTDFSDTLSLDADTSIAAGAAEELTYNKTFTDATSENGFVINFTASDTTSGTTAQYGLYLDNVVSTEGVDAVLVIDNSDTDDSVANGLLFIDAGGTITDALDASDAGITNALNVGANTITGAAAVIDFTDFDVSADGLIVLAPDGGGTGITITPSASLTTGLDVTDSNITNALSIGANTILGTSAVINFTNFDVAASGQVTLSPSSALTTAIDVTDADITNAISIGTNTLAITTGTIGSNAATVIDFTNFDVSASGITTTKSLVSNIIALPGGNIISGHTVNSNYISVNGGFGTGGLERLTSTGNLKNISTITAGQANFATAGASFDANADQAAGTNPYGIAAADFNADGYIDLAVVNINDDDATILINDQDGTFTANALDMGTGNDPRSITSADFNTDGYPDLAVANESHNDVSIHINDGDGTFTRNSPDVAVGTLPRRITSADFNADGYPDLAVTNLANDDVSILLNDQDGTFTKNGTDQAVGDNPFDIEAADFNADGYIDLAVANFTDNDVSILINDKDGTFTRGTDQTVGDEPWHLTAADLNGDGYPDLAVGNSNAADVSILINDQDGTFTKNASDQAVGSIPYEVVAADFNGDGFLDLAVSNVTGNDVSILINDTNTLFYANAHTGVLSIGSSTFSGTTAVIDFTDFDVSNDGKVTLAGDADAIDLTITSPNTTADVISITANSLTTGNGLNVVSNSSSSSTRTIAQITQSSVVPSNATVLSLLQEGSSTVLFIEHNAGGLSVDINAAGNADIIDVLAEQVSFSNDILSLTANEADTGGFNFVRLISDVDGTPDTELTIDQDGLITTDGGLTVTPSAALTTAIDASDALIVNALSVGANTITGATAVIDFTNFDVAASGQTTIGSFGSDTATTVCQNAGLLSTCSSSIRYKENVIDLQNGLEIVQQLRPVNFKWISRDEQDLGFIAEEVEAIYPLLATYVDEQIEGVKYGQLTAVLTKAIQEQQEQILTVNDLLGISIEVLTDTDTDTELEVLTTKQATVLERLSDVEAQLAVYTLANTDQLTTDVGGATVDQPYLTLDDLKDLVVTGSLVVQGDTTLFGNLTVEGNVNIKGRLSLSNQQAGFATIPAGGRQVKVEYDTPYETTPLIQITPRRDGRSDEALPTYWISKTDEEGFVITTDRTVNYDISFSYTTLPVADPQETIGEVEETDNPEPPVAGDQDNQQDDQQSNTNNTEDTATIIPDSNLESNSEPITSEDSIVIPEEGNIDL